MFGCPDDAALAAFLDRRPGSTASAVDKHLSDCSACRILVDVAAPHDVDSAPAAGDLVSEQPGRYRIEGECGRGGQSIVWIAFDRNLGCEVAFKVLQPAAAAFDVSARSRACRRFLREARIAASLSHPAIVPIHELGIRDDGSLYYTMKLVRGRTLAEAFAAAPTLDARLALLGHVVDVCQGIAYAHRQGVIHRDIKPGNVMVGEFGETVIVDWGLAKPIDGEPSGVSPDAARLEADEPLHHTVSGTTVGTPAYMSPEQAAGQLDDVDERSDVWGLGTLLYELLAGSPPFTGGPAAEVISRVVRGDRPSVAASCPDAPPELAAIAERALARDPARRYSGADGLAAELSAYLGGRRVRTYDYSAWELVSRFASMHRTVFIAILSVVAVAFVSAIAVAVAYRSETSARERAEASGRAETAALHRASTALAHAYADKAEQLSAQGHHLSAQIYAAGALVTAADHGPAAGAVDPELALRARSVLHEGMQQPIIRREYRLQRRGRVRQLRFGGDGGTLLATSEDGLSAFSLTTGRFERVRPLVDKPIGLGLAADGAALVVTRQLARSATIHGGIETGLLAAADPAQAAVAAVSPDGETIATGDMNGRIALWNRAGVRQAELAGHDGQVVAMAFSPDGAVLASGGRDGAVRAWDVAHTRSIALFAGHSNTIRALTFAGGRRIVSAGQDRTLRVWNVESPAAPPIVLEGHRTPVSAVAVSADDRLLATGDYEGQIRLWDLRSRGQLVVVQAHAPSLADPLGTEITALAFSADGSRLATAAVDGSAAIWSLRAPPAFAARLPALAVFFSELSRDGRVIAVPCANREVSVWDVTTGAKIELPPLPVAAQALALAPDGSSIALVGEDGALRVWDRRQARLQVIPAARIGGATGAEFSPDGAVLVTGSGDGKIRLWKADGLEPAGELRAGKQAHTAFAFSPDATRLAAVDSSGAITVLRPDTGAEIARFTADGWSEVAFSRDGASLIAAGQRGVQVWQTADWSAAGRIDTGAVYTRAVYTPDDRSIVTASYDGTVRVWSAKQMRPLLAIPTTTPTVAIAADGRSLLLPRGNLLGTVALDAGVGSGAPQQILAGTESALGARLDGFDLRVSGD